MKLIVFGETYKVQFQDEVMDNGKLAMGLFDPVHKTIAIEKGLTKQVTMVTLLHEMGHAVSYELGIADVLHPDVEEIFVDGMGRCFVKNMTGIFNVMDKMPKPTKKSR